MRKRIAVVGGGIAGLAAAVRLRDLAPSETEIIVYEQSGAVGGKLRTASLDGIVVEQGAESFLTTDPAGGDSAAVQFARRVGLGDALVHPAAVPAAIALGGDLLPLPRGTLFGIPADPASVAAVAHADSTLDTPAADGDSVDGEPLLGPGEDVAVGGLVRRRLGDEVVDRLVDPLLGGVYAGRADQLSLAVTMPALARAARRTPTLVAAVRAALAATPREPGTPVFATVDGGMSRLAQAAAHVSGARIEMDRTVRTLRRTATGFRLTLGPVPEPEVVDVDGVVLAVPAKAAARLLGGVDETVAHTVAELDYASVALVSFVLDAADLPELSGLLVPAVENRLVKAATFLTRKWPHLGRGSVVVRASAGRYGDERQLQRSDDDLVRAVHHDLAELIGLPVPTRTRVQRWGGALPQYRPGHLDRVAAVRAALDQPGLALAGAAYDGVGVPACIRSGETAAEHILKSLEASR